LRALFTLTIFLSAFLLFLVQPMIAKMILPIFGGAPSVWLVSMVFFQLALLVGYAYAHWSVGWLGVRKQRFLHLGLLAFAGLTLPFAVPEGWRPGGAPAAALLGLLAALVGASYLAVSAGSPLLQKWFAATGDREAKDPYFLYAASNVGSMLALIAYPLLVEPLLPLPAQAVLWAGGYALLLVGMAGAAVLVKREVTDRAEPTDPISWRTRGLWVALAAAPSALLLGVTAFLTGNVAPIPLLWVVPLALYLLTFVLAFARNRRVKTSTLGRFVPMAVTPLAIAIILESSEPLLPLAILHLLTFFLAAWMCHSRLVDLRPPEGRLTEFYLWLSVGGVVGGAFAALVAPVVFSRLVEYPIALIVAVLLRPPSEDGRLNKKDWLYVAVVAAATVLLVSGTRIADLPAPAVIALGVGIPAILCFLAVDRVWRYGLSLGALFLIAHVMGVGIGGRLLYAERSFFGIHRVVEQTDEGRPMHLLTHGNTIHGMQDLANPGIPLTYYHPTGPVGQVFEHLREDPTVRTVGLVGLGVGSLAAYGRSDQRFIFYEIDPVVEKIARDERLFRFLSDSRAQVDVVLGDARLSLQDGQQLHDLLVLDAFTSDAVPMHLLTVEALRLYFARLSEGGMIAFHISNRYLDLEPVLTAAAAELGLATLYQHDGAVSEQEMAQGKQPSQWYLLARSPNDFREIQRDFRWEVPEPREGVAPWTDDFSNLIRAFRRD
jgi:spermidine synthase